MSTLHARQTCRVCDRPVTPVLTLGDQPIATSFASGDQPALTRRVPLDLVRCDPHQHQGACGLLQLRHTVPGDVLYSSYWYRSGVNQTMRDNLHGIARRCEELAPIDNSVMLDIGCNDGTLLDGYKGVGQRVGFDPSDVARYAEGRGHTIVRDFFSLDAIRKLGFARAKIVTSIAMFYDLDDPVGFALDVAQILQPAGVWCMELHYLPAMLQSNGYDAIVHEHVAYYSLAVIERVLADAGLEVIRAERNGINGGSLRLYIGHRGAHRRTADAEAALRRLRVYEFEMGLDLAGPYAEFRRNVEIARGDLVDICLRARNDGKRVHVYGASTKGNTILQHCGIGPELVELAADRNPDKWGSTTATGIPIVSEEDSRARRPDYYLALPWHFLDEFERRERQFLERGGRFITPLPTARIVEPTRLGEDLA